MAERKGQRKRTTKGRRKAKGKAVAKPKAQAAEDVELQLSEKEQRDVDIFRAWMRGLNTQSLANMFGLSTRTIERIVAEQKKEATVTFRMQAREVMQDHVLRVEAIVDELAAVAAASQGSARISAIRTKLEALKERREVLQSVGILPHDLGTLRVELDIDRQPPQRTTCQ